MLFCRTNGLDFERALAHQVSVLHAWGDHFFRIHVAFSCRIKRTCNKNVRLSTRGYTIPPTHTPPGDSHINEKQIVSFWCCLLDSNSGLNNAGQIRHILTWQRNSQVWWRAVCTVGEYYSGRHAILQVKVLYTQTDNLRFVQQAVRSLTS